MKIIILGAGGVGGYYGGLLARHGQEVVFIARGAHLAAIRADGLLVKSVHGDFHVQPARATDSANEAGIADLLLVCTKTTSNEAIFKMLPAMLGPQTAVMSLQNGVEAAEQIGAVVGMEHMLAGATWLSSTIEAPGVIHQFTQFHRVVAGELDGSTTPRLEAIAGAFKPTGVTFEISANIAKVLWTKFLFIAAVSGVGALTRLGIGDYRGVPESRQLLVGLMEEVREVAEALDITLEADVLEKTLAFIDSNTPTNKPSMQKDVEAGVPFELETIIGVIERKGRTCGVPTPIANFIYSALLPVYLKASRQG